jgi:DUF4097 and DUF4098 domain-containing protein YvlB
MLKEQARIQRQAYRAQRDAYKAQRYVYRQQVLGARRRSLLGPLLLVAIGVVLLLVHQRSIPAEVALDLYSRWWPMLFVFAGVVLLLEWTVDQIVASQHPDMPPLRRRSFGGGVVALLILLSIFGAIGMVLRNHARELVNDLGGDSDNWAMLLGDKREVDQTVDEALPAGSSLAIDNAHGDVTVTGGSADGKIHIAVHKEVYSRSDAEAERNEETLSPQIAMNGSLMSVRVPGLEGATADLTVTLPEKTAITITANHGDVEVKGIKSTVNVTANHGDVDLGEIAGDATARMNRRGASFTAHNIDGSLVLRGEAQDLTVSDIKGQVTIEGEFYGTTHVEQVRSGVHFHTSRTDFQVVRLDGEIEISSDASLTVDHAAGPTLLTTRNRNITMDRMDGDISVTNSNGTVDITSAPPLGNITVHNSKGAVNVTMPDHAGFSVQAETTDGGIDNEFGLPDVGNDDHATMTGTVGHGGPRVKLNTTHAHISIREAEIAPLAAPAPPAPPAPPVPPGAKGPKAPKKPASPREITF